MAKSTQPAKTTSTSKGSKPVQRDSQGRPVTLPADPAAFGRKRS
ncbi:hypothetical protein AB0F91_39930 [Amycolatopsis sp. NPDC023774]